MVYELIGWLGTASIVLGYFLVTTKRISPQSTNYQLMNLLGAICIASNAYINGALPSVGLNIIWGAIALYGLYKIFH